MSRLPRRTLALLAVLPGLGCALWEAPPESYALPPLEFPEPEIDVPLLDVEARTALWLAKSPIGSLYLFGSAELAGEEETSFGGDIEAAYAASDEVVYEVDLDAVEPAEMIELMKRYGTLARPATLESEVSRETWALLEAAHFAETGRYSDALRSMQPWLVSFAIANHASLAGDLDPLTGIADQVHARVRAHPWIASAISPKPVVGLRSLESQFQMFAALPRGVQDALLRNALGGGPLAGMDAALAQRVWLTEDDWFSALREPVRSEMALLYEHLVHRRNEEMADRLFHLAIDGKLRFVAVGVVHLVGKRGIPALLAQRGFRVSRVQ